jgi:membrane-bound lytic murein transglycosylase D
MEKKMTFPTTIGRRARFGGAVALALLATLVGVERGRDVTDGAAVLALEEAAAEVRAASETATAGRAEWDIPNLDHQRVDYWVKRFQTDRRTDIVTYLERMGRYQPLISEALAEREMPQDLVYLAMIESGFDPKAYSHARASGIWQFISETGKRYGLDINRAVDERNDPVKATDAALRYLGDLHARFGSWYLAAAAYNSGENRVARILREVTGRKKGTDEDYYRIWNRLPRETRDYVPLMVAAARIGKDPVAYGFDELEVHDPWTFAEVVAKPATPLKTLAKQAGTSIAALKALNPHLKMDRTRNDEPMVVRVPAPSEVTLAD